MATDILLVAQASSLASIAGLARQAAGAGLIVVQVPGDVSEAVQGAVLAGAELRLALDSELTEVHDAVQRARTGAASLHAAHQACAELRDSLGDATTALACALAQAVLIALLECPVHVAATGEACEQALALAVKARPSCAMRCLSGASPTRAVWADLGRLYGLSAAQAWQFVAEAGVSLHVSLVQDGALSWQPMEVPVRAPWWRAEPAASELVRLAESLDGPAYVYSEAALRVQCDKLLALAQLPTGKTMSVFYAIKANSHPDILRYLWSRGIGLECVSLGEIDHVTASVPGASDAPTRLLYTPNFGTREEYAAVLARGCLVTIDNPYVLEHWAAVFSGHSVLLRIDPGVGRGHHKYVQTGGNVSKFGITLDRLEAVAAQARAHAIRVVGLHAHTGSGIDVTTTWAENVRLLAAAARQHFAGTVRLIDAGGGLPIPYRPWESELDLGAVARSLGEATAAFPEFDYVLEPGRFLVASPGVLLARVTQLKEKGEGMRYLGISAGMNALIRPMLYGAYHAIANLSRAADSTAETVLFNVVGPICESGDVLGTARRLPSASREGDVICVADAGAYGFAMSSDYNLRPRPAEIYLREL